VDIVVLENPEGTTPVRIAVWSPRTAAGYFLTFGPAPNDQITVEKVLEGSPSQTLLGGTVAQSVVGKYQPGEPYHLVVTLDKERGLLSYHLSGVNGPPDGHPMLVLSGGANSNPLYSDIYSAPVQVVGGNQYNFGALVNLVSGHTAFKIDVEWLDDHGKFIGFVNNWRPITDLNGWTEKRYTTVAPPRAKSARLILGSADNTSILVADPFFAASSNPDLNLLRNSDLSAGSNGWTLITRPQQPPQIDQGAVLSVDSSVTNADMSALLQTLKLTMSVSAYSSHGTSSALLQNYRIQLPPETAGAVHVDDQLSFLLVLALVLLGSVLVSAVAIRWIARTVPKLLSANRFTRSPIVVEPGPIAWRWILAATSLLAVYSVGNAVLFGLGTNPFDMQNQKVWSYVAVQYGPAQLYVLPLVVSVAKAWGGTPYSEAVFAYEPAMAYLFTFLGWVHRLTLNGPAQFSTDAFSFEFLVKATNVLFGFLDGVLLYLILSKTRIKRSESLVAAALFVFNPAVWFSMSIWGANHVITLFPLLLAILLIETQHPVGAWIAIGVAALTRPQALAIAPVIAFVCLKRFTFMQNINAVAWSVIALFLGLAPYALQIAPSLPVDFMRYMFRLQELGGNEPALTTVSLDSLSIWPLITLFTAHQSGLNRVFFPSQATLFGSLTYQNVGQLLTLGVLVASAILTVVRPRRTLLHGAYLPVAALAMMGFLMFATGIAGTHFVLALPFILLCRRYVNAAGYFVIVAVWTTTTFVSMYGNLAISLAPANYLHFALFGNDATFRDITNYFGGLYSSDRFLTVGVVANLIALTTVASAAVSNYLRAMVSTSQITASLVTETPVHKSQA
jgi:hypothetical protein